MQPHRTPFLLIATTAALLLAGCVATPGDPEIFGTSEGGTITDDIIVQQGSSTVLPLAERWAEEFGTARNIQISVSGGGSGAGASGLCNGEVDLGDMSRAMRESEKETCRSRGIEPVEWKIAFDGLSIVVSDENTFVQDLTVAQLAHIFQDDDHATRWNQVDAAFPDRPIELCYPGDDSGTYEYFNEAILDGEEPRKGDGVHQSEDDNVIVTCLADNPDAIGYFGFAYVQENSDRIRPVAVGGVSPTFETIADGTYDPLSRPIYIYTNGVPTGILGDYFHYVFHPEGGQRIIEDVGYVALDEATRLAMLNQLEG